MARSPDTNEQFLREVDEELRRDQALSFGRRYGVVVIALIVAALLAFGGYLYWQHRAREAAALQGEQMQDAFNDLAAGKADAAAKPLGALSTSDVPAYRVLAIYTQADIALQKNDLKGAAAKFAAVANDTSVAAPFRDLALIRQTTAEFDTLRPEQVVTRLRALAVPGNAWFGSAGELVAAAYIKQGRRDLAGQMFGRVARDQDVPPTIRQRAVQMAGVLGVDAVGGNEGTTKQ